MLTKLVRGRLGNQMFQYAAMRSIQINYFKDEKLNFDFHLTRGDGKEEDGFTNTLTNFQLSNNDDILFEQKFQVNLKQKFILGLYFLSYKILKLFVSKEKYENKKKNLEDKFQKLMNKNGLYFYTYGYYDFDFSKSNSNKIFAGFYESVKYFENIKDILQKDFEPISLPLKSNAKLYDQIENTNSVCISIRRGDFLDPKHKERHFVCDDNYFYKSIEVMDKKIENPQYIIFSDDIEWVKQNMNFPKGTLYESGNDPVYEKLRLMYSCKHFIISNSTFSWWAQFLSRNENKIVIAPKRWQNFGFAPDIYDEKWILL